MDRKQDTRSKYLLIGKYKIPTSGLISLPLRRSLNDTAFIRNNYKMHRHAIDGVSMSQIDVLCEESVDVTCPHLLLEVGYRVSAHSREEEKLTQIPRLTFYNPDSLKAKAVFNTKIHMVHQASLHTWVTESSVKLAVRTADQSPIPYWDCTLRRVDVSDFDTYQLDRILLWHWTRYFQVPISHDDCISLIPDFIDAISQHCIDNLNDANRVASRLLYGFARDNGWRKLTVREKEELQSPGSWVSAEQYAALRIAAGKLSPTGCGEFTITSAAGQQDRIS